MKTIRWLMFPLLSSGIAIGATVETYVTDRGKYEILPQKIHRQKLDDGQLTVLGFTVGKHTLQDVQQKLGLAKLLPRREQAPNRICYASSQDGGQTIVVFEAGPIGGWKQLTAITLLARTAPFSDRGSCAVSQLVTEDVGTNGGLKLGLDREGLKAILGVPTFEQRSNLLYVYRIEQRMTDKQIEKMAKLWPRANEHPYLDVSSDVEAIFANSKLISLTVSKIETY